MCDKNLQPAVLILTFLTPEIKLKKTGRTKVVPDFKLYNNNKLPLYMETPRRSSNFPRKKSCSEKNDKEVKNDFFNI